MSPGSITLSPPQTTSQLALLKDFFFFTNADFFSFSPQCGAWSQANKRLLQRPQTLENTINLIAEIKLLFLETFQGSRT